MIGDRIEVNIAGGLDIPLPRMVHIRQKFDTPKLASVKQTVAEQFKRPEVKAKIKPGMTIAVGCGSRGIANIAECAKQVIVELQALGAKPFIFPAMGSHGGATPEGQREVLESYGITESFVGCPIHSQMDVVELGKLEGMPVYMDKLAAAADGVVLVCRVKPHTNFRAPIESGIVKMMTIGMGKIIGASELHTNGMDAFGELLPKVAKFIMSKKNFLIGVGMVENAADETAIIEAVPAEQVFEREPVLQAKAKEFMPRIGFEEVDVLIVEHIGKNISGAGMDPNITGRNNRFIDWEAKPMVKKIVVLGLTPETHGNACGIGLADVDHHAPVQRDRYPQDLRQHHRQHLSRRRHDPDDHEHRRRSDPPGSEDSGAHQTAGCEDRAHPQHARSGGHPRLRAADEARARESEPVRGRGRARGAQVRRQGHFVSDARQTSRGSARLTACHLHRAVTVPPKRSGEQPNLSRALNRVHIHLDAVGGVAGDMFVAAVLDAFPDHATRMLDAIRTAGLPEGITCRLAEHRDHALTGLRFLVEEPAYRHREPGGRDLGGTQHRHVPFHDIRSQLQNAKLAPAVRDRAIDIFTLLSQAEAKVHGGDAEAVSFHELGGWDSIADMVGAAYLIDALGASSWTVSALPQGSGRVKTDHGWLPIPTPATVLLLQGFELIDDGLPVSA